MLKEWIARQFGGKATETALGSSGSLNLAVAALLVEVLRADYEVAAGEREQVVRSISKLLNLCDADSTALLELAERQSDQSHDLYQFTSMINQGYSAAEKERLVEHLWRVARADETIHKYEEHLIRRIAELLHVPHASFIAAKLRSGE
ncbi:MAG TPA: TerB family tellurite resistance protein [Steroidobacteraceae bacterium]